MNAVRQPMTVGDVMTCRVVAVTRRASFKEIVRALEQWHVSAVPVVEKGTRVVGVVSEADLLRKEERRGDGPPPVGASAGSRGASALTAEELMTSPTVTVRGDASLAWAAGAMARHQVKRLPVVDERGMLKGVVSRGDLLKVFLRSAEDIARDVRENVVARLFPGAWRSVEVDVEEGVVTLSGLLGDRSLVPVADRLARSVEGVVEVRFELTPNRV
ncbi:CBS domain-containing protein [Actinacidiphila glaucinigra]|uniref:CBS domain-containing protein n=1 Tax=Actinacidiphila glaucinigra TaxID=235986 RepID=UPI0029BC4EE7|nr:CBS domain-containing protein [Streptomyces sp. PA03-3a]